jgi:hypothetical protein
MEDFIAAIQASPLAKKRKQLYEIYDRFEKDALEYRENAVCRKGCSFCCTFMGNVDITTLEGIIIRERMTALSPQEKSLLSSRIGKNREEKEKGRNTPCPFLDQHHACSIYDVRPFSCRQLYSLRKCEGGGATIHRQAYELSRKAITRIQHLDGCGYSGHLSFILHLIEDAEFRELYLLGGFDPDGIRDFGRSHQIFINRQARNKRQTVCNPHLSGTKSPGK